ncbi:1,4-alpha-glucan branching enzyme [Synchytrium endobioticum]|uniref:1,4-alpha-glucan-branching enzyme n=1 Tax=Synchytrium endobioticum TaxID=286115 RepID=A0A507DJV7_9FUNG|nr:1,4-alpha-glucan branching enzyme [Synchytrium endobioticum]
MADIPKGNAVNGAKLFKTRCAQCHVCEKDGAHKVGPNLFGLLGRTSGTSPGFQYSAAMEKKKVLWDEEQMFVYLENPKKFVPGTKMVFPGFKKPQDRADVIAYLKEAGRRHRTELQSFELSLDRTIQVMHEEKKGIPLAHPSSRLLHTCSGDQQLGGSPPTYTPKAQQHQQPMSKVTTNPIPISVQPLIDLDPYLGPHKGALEWRQSLARDWVSKIIQAEGSLDKFTTSYQQMGLNVVDGGIRYREWAPGAVYAALMGDFNNWDGSAHPMKRNEYGTWELFLPNKPDGSPAIPHNSKIKLTMATPSGERIDRIPAYIKRVVQDLSVSPVYEGVFWNPPNPYKFKNASPPKPSNPKIYEAHVGIASPEPTVATYANFTKNVLPRIKKLGYDTIQLMAIMEHPYYASFGYQVSSFYASSSRYGNPEELKQLIDTAHGLGLTVLLDVVHSHASNNVLDGLNNFDGTTHQYFHDGDKGRHELWDSRLFNYGHYEVIRFLLSNLRYWIREYGFDGFRFDGVTSMLYLHHGIGTGFSGNYGDYFGDSVDMEAVTYLVLANAVMKHLHPHITTIAEDVSGMPTICRPVSEGGMGFDFRLGMAIPDMWIKLLKEVRDEDWDMGNICHTLTNRRWKEGTIAYCESHDQALVGDKTLAFWLMDKEMYDYMSDLSPLTPIIDRGLALHKMIRLLTNGLGGEGYLNFIGNEFGHPEWLDFPRAGNGNSFHYARRQYNLAEDNLLRYKYLSNFDAAMHALESHFHWLSSSQWVSLQHQSDKLVVFERGNLLWVFNFHPTKSYSDYRVGTQWAGKYKVVLNTDSKQFCGHGRIDESVEHFSTPEPWCGRDNYLQLYIPSRSAFLLSHT